jgi:hypothetical protein
MRNVLVLICCGLALLPLSTKTQAQGTKTGKRLGIEMGYNGFFGNTIVPDSIRSMKSVDVSEPGFYEDYYMGDCYQNTAHVINKIYAGIKYETLFAKNKIGILYGLRFYQLSAQLDHDSKYDAFIWLLREEGLHSDFVTIRSMNQKNYYGSVPLEIRFFPYNKDCLLKVYVKMGGTLNYRLSTNYKIDFQAAEMSVYTDAVESQIKKPSDISGYVFTGVGLKWGKNKDPWFNTEIQFPGFMIAQRKHPFVEPYLGVGIQLSAQIPINKINK